MSASGKELRNPVAHGSIPKSTLNQALNPGASSSSDLEENITQSFRLPSTLSSGNATIETIVSSDLKEFKAKLSPEEITAIYRRLPIQSDMHDYELSSSVHLLKVMASCMKYARQENAKLSGGDALDNIWGFHLAFYDTLFPVFDALADLEQVINDESKTVDDLKTVLTNYEKKFKDILEKLENNKTSYIHHGLEQSYLKDVSDCLSVVDDDLQKYRDNIAASAHEDKASALLSDTTIVRGIKPLGSFVTDQVYNITLLLKKYRNAHEHFPGQQDFIEPDSDYQKIKVFEDRLAFKKSFAGIRFSSAKPIPQENINILRFAGGNTRQLNQSKYLIDLNQFLSKTKKNDLNALEKLLSVIADQEPTTAGYSSWLEAINFNLALAVMTFAETGATVGLRFPVNILTGFMAGLVSLYEDSLKLISEENTQEHRKNVESFRLKLTKFSDQWLQQGHHMLSSSGINLCSVEIGGLSYLRKKQSEIQEKNHHAQLQSETLGQDVDRKALLKKLTTKQESSLALLAAKYLSADFINKHIQQGYRSFFWFFYEGLLEYFVQAKDALFTKGETDQSLYAKKINELKILLNEVKHSQNIQHAEIDSVIKNLAKLAGVELPAVIKSVGENQSLDKNSGEKHSSNSTVERMLVVEEIPSIPLLHPHAVGPAESMMDFVELIALEFSIFINSIFKTLPLPATLSQAIAFYAAAASYLGLEGPVNEFLTEALNELSKAFTGEEAISSMRIMLAAFLLWKLSTLGIETILAICKGDMDFLEKLYGDPEKILLGLTTFIGLGIALQFVPILPESTNLLNLLHVDWIDNVLSAYCSMFNIFIVESRVAWHGQIPLNFLEYFFLGLKAVFLIGAFFSGEHKPDLQADPEKLKRLVAELSSPSFGDPDLYNTGLELEFDLQENPDKAINFIFQLFDALGKSLGRDDAQRLFNMISQSDSQENKRLLNDLFNQHIFRGSNNLVQLVSVLPFFFVTYPYRLIRGTFAKLVGDHATLHSIEKSFSAEKIMAIQVPAALIENFRSFVLSIDQLANSVGALALGAKLSVSNKLGCGSEANNFRSSDGWYTFANMHNHLANLLKPFDLISDYIAMRNTLTSESNPVAYENSMPSLETWYANESHKANTHSAHRPQEHKINAEDEAYIRMEEGCSRVSSVNARSDTKPPGFSVGLISACTSAGSYFCENTAIKRQQHDHAVYNADDACTSPYSPMADMVKKP